MQQMGYAGGKDFDFDFNAMFGTGFFGKQPGDQVINQGIQNKGPIFKIVMKPRQRCKIHNRP